MRIKKQIFAAGAVAAAALAVSAPVMAGNLIANGNFAAGDIAFSSGYEMTTMTPYRFQNDVHGIYAVIPIGSVAGQSAYGDWTNVTTDPSGNNTNVYVADGSTEASLNAWSQTVVVTANTNYAFSFYAAEISDACCSNASLVPTIDGTTLTALDLTGSWVQDTGIWNSGSNTSATFSITDSNTSGPYNDFVLTDITLSPAGAVPEPATWAMMLLGFGAIGGSIRARREKRRDSACV